MKISWLLVAALASALCGTAALAQEGGAQPDAGEADTAEAVEACVRDNLPKESTVQTVKLDSKDRTGSERSLLAKYYWKRGKKNLSKTLIEVEAPSDVRGSAYLILEQDGRSDDIFSYLPELRKVRRLHSNTMGGTLFGTDFTYADFNHIVRVTGDAASTLLPEEVLNEHRVAVLETRPAPEDGSEYESIRTYVDRSTCVPMKVEFFGAGGKLVKVMDADPSTLVKIADTWLAKTIVLRDVRNESETRLVIDEVEIDAKVHDRYFTTSHLERRR